MFTRVMSADTTMANSWLLMYLQVEKYADRATSVCQMARGTYHEKGWDIGFVYQNASIPQRHNASPHLASHNTPHDPIPPPPARTHARTHARNSTLCGGIPVGL